jgi:hypothetical protein
MADIACPSLGSIVLVRTPGVAFGGQPGREENPAIVTFIGNPLAIDATVFARGNVFHVHQVAHESSVPDGLRAATRSWRWPSA